MASRRPRGRLTAPSSCCRGEPVGLGEGRQHRVDVIGVGEGGADEVVLDLRVLGAGEQHPVGPVDGPAGPAHLLVVGDGRPGRLEVDDEVDVRVVVAHAEGRGGDHHLERARTEPFLDVAAARRPSIRRCRWRRRSPGCRSQAPDPFGVADGQAVDDPATGEGRDGGGQPGHALAPGREAAPPAEPGSRGRAVPADSSRSFTQLLGHVGHHPVVGRGGGAQHRDVGRQGLDDARQAPVVGPEVVSPVGDAVHLVDHQEPQVAEQVGQHLGRGTAGCSAAPGR